LLMVSLLSIGGLLVKLGRSKRILKKKNQKETYS
jgi:hypothetical protein